MVKKSAKKSAKTAQKPAPSGARAKAPPPAADSSDWRAATIAKVRAIITKADPGIIEEVKWRKPSNAMLGIPVWSHPACGMICTGETYKDKVKLTFAKGASLPDPSSLFNASLDGGTRRAIDIREGDAINAKALTALVKAAVKMGPASSVANRSRSSR